jgi:hypothetical protein
MNASSLHLGPTVVDKSSKRNYVSAVYNTLFKGDEVRLLLRDKLPLEILTSSLEQKHRQWATTPTDYTWHT